MFTLRFDMRAPAGGTPPSILYPAALEMAEWTETRGLILLVVSEHHAAEDGFLPSPLPMAAALAARTKSAPIAVSALILPLYNPVRLAEDIGVLDHLSGGRISYTLGIGYRPEEFESLGVDYHRRGELADSHLDILLKALGGERFNDDGRSVLAQPAPEGKVRISYGGGTPQAARRAARFGLGFNAQNNLPEVVQAYYDECTRHGHAPGRVQQPRPGFPTTVFVADDVDRAWQEIGPYLLHDAVSYAHGHHDPHIVSLSKANTIDALRAENGSHRIYTVEQAVEAIARDGVLSLHPLCGGLPPDIAWTYLRRVVDEVLPQVPR
ncbi:LLM class flavin-dependent oxidoreductase [Mycobacterium sp. ITM-2016-00317]|uniref:LLM class flavin-dependent oxidoreductase n=1 Tax=Mycobacterium sp. ITM-2016-00317 TaxID=2099694 RepID=UPI00287FA6B3|nr:LLM class flavin-dependent oxidoreductase [Mycobacterium sp. ITM-2016-00317]WNG87252.1 LLM class flavin-dependent oxidoreductase [Mycobacterium sp. ITM-2016-00317]